MHRDHPGPFRRCHKSRGRSRSRRWPGGFGQWAKSIRCRITGIITQPFVAANDRSEPQLATRLRQRRSAVGLKKNVRPPVDHGRRDRDDEPGQAQSASESGDTSRTPVTGDERRGRLPGHCSRARQVPQPPALWAGHCLCSVPGVRKPSEGLQVGFAREGGRVRRLACQTFRRR